MERQGIQGKVAVYTVLFGDYDNLLAVKVFDPTVDYICFTDKEFSPPDPWELRVVQRPTGDPRYDSRYYFDQSSIVLPEYEYTIMHGANARLTSLPTPLLSFVETTDIAAFKHPHRNSVYDEFNACLQLGKDTLANMKGQMVRYHEEKFPGNELSACILLVRHNTDALRTFEEMWWNEVSSGSHRDQLSFDYCRWKLNMPVTYIPGDPFSSQYFQVWQHKR